MPVVKDQGRRQLPAVHDKEGRQLPAMNYVVIRIHKKGVALSENAAKLLVDYALLRCRCRPWPRVTVESFPGRGETLLLARPAPSLSFHLADYAIPILSKYARRAKGRGFGLPEKIWDGR